MKLLAVLVAIDAVVLFAGVRLAWLAYRTRLPGPVRAEVERGIADLEEYLREMSHG